MSQNLKYIKKLFICSSIWLFARHGPTAIKQFDIVVEYIFSHGYDTLVIKLQTPLRWPFIALNLKEKHILCFFFRKKITAEELQIIPLLGK